MLVTGVPKSGSTWIGNILSLANYVYYIHESFNPSEIEFIKSECADIWRKIYIDEDL